MRKQITLYTKPSYFVAPAIVVELSVVFYMHYTTIHYTTLHYTTLHYTTIHYTTIH